MGKAKRLGKLPENVVITETSPLVEAVISGISEKKGHNIVVMNLRATGSTLADYFVVCHGDSRTQVSAIADSVEEIVIKMRGEKPSFKEGHANAEWILLDYINVVVHIFQREQREFYGIERFWADAETRTVN